MLLIWYGAQVAGGVTEATTAGDIRRGLVPIAFMPRAGRAIEPVTFNPAAPSFSPRPIVRFK